MKKQVKKPVKRALKPKTINARHLHPIYEGKRASRIIKNGCVYNYVGIGWVNEGKADADDLKRYPQIVYDSEPMTPVIAKELMKLFNKGRKFSRHRKCIRSGYDAEKGDEYTEECKVTTAFRTVRREWHDPYRFKAATFGVITNGRVNGYVNVDEFMFDVKIVKEFQRTDCGFKITYKKSKDDDFSAWEETYTFPDLNESL